ncbi:LAGLIDADG family homing endonuclease [archaeon]|nr:LAGLIDADG family homing endonuclease [archaeon]
MPQEILDSTDEIKTAFLQAYFDDEETVDTRQAMARYYTINPETTESLVKLLYSIGIKSGIGKTKYLARQNRDNVIYHVNITGIENVNKFFTKIKPLHKMKYEKLLRHFEKGHKQAFKVVVK